MRDQPDDNVYPIRSIAADGAPAVRTPPHNQPAEQALLGALLISNPAYWKVCDFLKPEHFGSAIHSAIYDAIAKLIERGEEANPVVLKAHFENDDRLITAGGPRYLAKLATAAVTVHNAEQYARHVHDLYLRRQLIALYAEFTEEAYKPDLDDTALSQMVRLDKRLTALGSVCLRQETLGTALQQAVEAVERVYKADGALVGIPTGLVDLDGRLGGLHGSDLVLVAGRPGHGKTALALGIATAAARAGYRGMMFELEMSAEQLGARQLAAHTGISVQRQRIGPIDTAVIDAVVRASEELSVLPVVIDDSPITSVAQIRARVRRECRRRPVDLVIIDYIQLMATNPENRANEVSSISQGLKMLAKELNIPVVALSQLNREVEKRDDKRPVLSDLRDSGSLETDADVVMFVYRHEYYLELTAPRQRSNEKEESFAARQASWEGQMEEWKNIGEILIRKNRHGQTRNLKVRWNGDRTRFEDLARGY